MLVIVLPQILEKVIGGSFFTIFGIFGPQKKKHILVIFDIPNMQILLIWLWETP